jgi:hypothetical protein
MNKVWQKYSFGTRMNSAFVENQGVTKDVPLLCNILEIYRKATSRPKTIS